MKIAVLMDPTPALPWQGEGAEQTSTFSSSPKQGEGSRLAPLAPPPDKGEAGWGSFKRLKFTLSERFPIIV